MKYEIAYISGSGNTEKLAHTIADSLPHRDTFVTDLSCEEITEKADMYLIGFGMKQEAIPIKIMDVLEKLEELEDKTVLLFVTAPVEPTEEHIKEVKRKLDPFIPNNCNYKGLYLCPGQVSEETFIKVKMLLEQDPENEQAKSAYSVCQQTMGHPNQEDINDACNFIREKLGI